MTKYQTKRKAVAYLNVCPIGAYPLATHSGWNHQSKQTWAVALGKPPLPQVPAPHAQGTSTRATLRRCQQVPLCVWSLG